MMAQTEVSYEVKVQRARKTASQGPWGRLGGFPVGVIYKL